jgi:uncharacterized protein with PQ loop repeat
MITLETLIYSFIHSFIKHIHRDHIFPLNLYIFISCVSYALTDFISIYYFEWQIFIITFRTAGRSPRDNKVRNKIEVILISTCCFWLTLIFITGLVLKDPQYTAATLTTVGSACASSNILFYAAPLLNIVEVVQTKDSSSLYYPALILNGASCILWVFYGLLGVNDIAIYLPSLVGLFLVIIGLGMCFIYPALYVDEHGEGQTEEATTVRERSPYAVYGTGREMSFVGLPHLGASGKVYLDRSNNDLHNDRHRNTRKGSFFRHITSDGKGASDSDMYSAPNFLNKFRISGKKKLLPSTKIKEGKEGKEEFDSRFDSILEDNDSTAISLDFKMLRNEKLLKFQCPSMDV